MMTCRKCEKEFTEFEGEEDEYMCFECLDQDDPGDENEIETQILKFLNVNRTKVGDK